MKLIKHSIISGCYLFEHPFFEDDRGSLIKIFSSKFKKFHKNNQIKQINYSITKKKYSIRGMHYQYPHSEYKIVKCIDGKVFDVIVDLRKNSKTFLKHDKIILDSNLSHILFIPKNCAHGYQTLEKNSKILYFHTSDYFPRYSRGLLYNDPNLNIKWPFKASNISKKDKEFSCIDKNKFKGL